MREFVILGHKASIDPGFTLNDLPGAGGRMDVLCRAIGASLFVSHGIRRDVGTHLLLQDCVHVQIRGDRVRRLNPDERSTAALIKHALKALSAGQERSTPGITVAGRSLPDLLGGLEDAGARPVVLHEDGIPIEDATLPEHPAFVLSDHTEFTEQDCNSLRAYPQVSLGSTALHTSQAITIVHYLLDRREHDRFDDLTLVHRACGESQARIVKALLEDSGIPVDVMTHVPPSMFPGGVDGPAEVRLFVRKRDVEQAQRVISHGFNVSRRCPSSHDPGDRA